MKPSCKQDGVALVIGLLMLVSLALLATAAGSGMAMQTRMTGNAEQRSLALSLADLADSRARAWLASRDEIDRGAGCDTDVMQPFAVHGRDTIPALVEFESLAWWQANAFAANEQPELKTLVGPDFSPYQAPRFIIEEIHCVVSDPPGGTALSWYRILSRAQAAVPGSVVVTESIVVRPWGVGADAAPFPSSGSMAEFCSQFDVDTPCGRVSWRQRR